MPNQNTLKTVNKSNKSYNQTSEEYNILADILPICHFLFESDNLTDNLSFLLVY